MHDMEHAGDLPATLGAWEWIALTEYGLACLRARLEPARERSAIRGTEVREVEADRKPFVRFRVHPLEDDPRSYVLVEARCRHLGGSGPVIRTTVTLGEESFPVVLEVEEAPDEGFPVVLGRDVLGATSVVAEAQATAGPPSVGWHPRPRRSGAHDGFGSSDPKEAEASSRLSSPKTRNQE